MRRLVLPALGVVCLGGCVSMEEAQSRCAPYSDNATAFQDCVDRDIHNQGTGLRDIARGMGNHLQQQSAFTPAPPQHRGFFKRTYVSGMNRICIYDDMGSERAITLRAVDLCPL